MAESLWKVVHLELEIRRNIVGAPYLWGFHLTLEMKGKRLQEVRVWVEQVVSGRDGPYLLRHSVQMHGPGDTSTDPVVTLPFKEQVLEGQVHPRVRELLYLWTCDKEVEPSLQPLLDQNLQELRRKDFRKYHIGSSLLASASVYLYDIVGEGEVWRYQGAASTWDVLRQIVLELPSDAVQFTVHFEVRRQIVGNAEYRVDHELDPATGKRLDLAVMGEFGVCVGLHEYFDDLYDTDEEFDQYIRRK